MKKVYIGILFFVFGFAALILLAISIKNSKVTKSWPSTSGKILESKVKTDRDRKNSYARILYEYTVNGKKYNSKRVRAYGILKFSFAEPASVVNEFPAGKDVVVFYDPEDPSSAVLLHGLPKMWFIPVLGSIVLILLGLFVAMKEHLDKQGKEKETDD